MTRARERIWKAPARVDIGNPYCDREKEIVFQGILWEAPRKDIADGFREPPRDMLAHLSEIKYFLLFFCGPRQSRGEQWRMEATAR